MVGRSDFWKRVRGCQHEINPNYCVHFRCDTLFCSGREVHCLKCGVFISHCDCFANDGMSGWPHKRYTNYWRKRWIDESRGRSGTAVS
jgi:hypothetical protein